MIGKIMLQVRRNGHGKDGKPVVFPKLVFLYDDNQVKADPFSSELFNEAVKTSAECMYPDYLSLSSRYGSADFPEIRCHHFSDGLPRLPVAVAQ